MNKNIRNVLLVNYISFANFWNYTFKTIPKLSVLLT